MTSYRFNFTSDNVPGAYYGALPELPVVQVAVPGSIEQVWNETTERQELEDGMTRWDSVWTVHFNHPDHLSVYPSETGYQYEESMFFGNIGDPSLPGELTLETIWLNESVYIWAPGDSLVFQYIELAEDGRTPTGKRVFSQNYTLVANDTKPATATPTIGVYTRSDLSFEITSTVSRLPPNPTYFTSTTTGAVSDPASITASSASETSLPANTGYRLLQKRSLWAMLVTVVTILALAGST